MKNTQAMKKEFIIENWVIRYSNANKDYELYANKDKGDLLATIEFTGLTPNENRNDNKRAKLIEAAPELLKSCQYLVDYFDLPDQSNFTTEQRCAIKLAKNIIKKATE